MSIADLSSRIHALRKESGYSLTRLCSLADVGTGAVQMALRGEATLSKDAEERLRTLLAQFPTPIPKPKPTPKQETTTMQNGTDTQETEAPVMRRLTDQEIASFKKLGPVGAIERALGWPKQRASNALRPLPERVKLSTQEIDQFHKLTRAEVIKHEKKAGQRKGNPKVNKVPAPAPKKTSAPKKTVPQKTPVTKPSPVQASVAGELHAMVAKLEEDLVILRRALQIAERIEGGKP